MSPPLTPNFSYPSPPYRPYPDSPPLGYYDDGLHMHPPHQMSDKRPSVSPEVNSPGLESVIDEEGLKEVVTPQVEPKTYELPPSKEDPRVFTEELQPRTCCGTNPRRFWIGFGVVLLLVLSIGLSTGLGVGLSEKQSSSSSQTPSSSVNAEYLIGGAINPAYYSTTGAFNGSGIALASQSFASNLEDATQGSIVMYFQHHTGQIRWMQLSTAGDWLGGTFSEVVAVDAKNNTPLSAVSYSAGGNNTWHVFYIDQNNMIRQRTNSNTTNVWTSGPIDDLNLQANDADQVGMQACWYGDDYGDSDYKHSPLPSTGPKQYSGSVGMHMWYASDNTTFQQLGWRDGDASWTHQGSFPNMNGHAGVGCYSWGPGTVTYAMMVNDKNTCEIWWKDTDTNLTSTATHPINQWVKSSVSIPDTNPSTSLGYTNYFYLQLADNTINGYNISWAAENTTIPAGSQFVVGDNAPGIPGTHLSVTALPNAGGGNSILVFYQQYGYDVTEYTRDFVAGQWTSTGIPIPHK